jgi:hypothetical protein
MNKEIQPADLVPQEPGGGPAEGQMHWRSLAAAIATISAVGAAIGLGIPLLSVSSGKPRSFRQSDRR